MTCDGQLFFIMTTDRMLPLEETDGVEIGAKSLLLASIESDKRRALVPAANAGSRPLRATRGGRSFPRRMQGQDH